MLGACSQVMTLLNALVACSPDRERILEDMLQIGLDDTLQAIKPLISSSAELKTQVDPLALAANPNPNPIPSPKLSHNPSPSPNPDPDPGPNPSPNPSPGPSPRLVALALTLALA